MVSFRCLWQRTAAWCRCLYTVPAQDSEFSISRARVGLGAEVNLRRSPKSPPCCHLWVQPRLHTLLPLSAYCHLHACSLLTFWASYNVLVTEFFLHMPWVKYPNAKILTWVAFFCWMSQTGKGICVAVQGTWAPGTREKPHQLHEHFPRGEQIWAGAGLVAGMKVGSSWKQREAILVPEEVGISWWTNSSQWQLARYCFSEQSFLCLFFH